MENLKDSSPQSYVDDYLPKLEKFIDIQWVKVAQAIQENIKKTKDGSVNYDFKAILAAEMSFLNADHLVSEFSAVLQHTDLQVEHHCLITELVKAIRETIISRIYQQGYLNDADEQKDKDVWDMLVAGLS